MRPPRIQLDLSPHIAVEVVPSVEQVIFVGILADKFINEGAVHLIVGLLGGHPGLGVD